MDKLTPSRVMYNDLKSFGGIKIGSAAEILLSDQPRAGGRSLRERGRNRLLHDARGLRRGARQIRRA